MESDEYNFVPPGIPQFNYQTLPKMTFPLLVKKVQKQKDDSTVEGDETESSSSEGSVFMFHETSLKARPFQGNDAYKRKYDERFV